jgi:S1-C subfamily serine protease
MFSDACTKIRESIFALIAASKGGTASGGTALMIAPGILVTAAHVTYKNQGDSTSFQETIRVIRAPEIDGKQEMESTTVIAVDPEYDIGLLKIENPRTKTRVAFTTDFLPAGTGAGAMGFPLMDVKGIMAGRAVPLFRFQGGYVSASYSRLDPISNRRFDYHETDVPMYKGSSGCPGFLVDGRVFGIHVAEWHDRADTGKPGQRAFSVWVPASVIVSFARKNGIEIVTAPVH